MGNEVDHGDYAPGWDNIPDQESNFALQNNAEARKAWVVLLEFFRNGKDAIGTGFFINLPGSHSDVILTAGHNLLGSTNMRAWIIERGKGPVEIHIDPSQFRICPQYEKTPDSTIDDYGAILLPRQGRPGFGFNIWFASQGLGEKGVVWSNLLKKVVPLNNNALPIHITGYSSKPVGNSFDGEGIVITKGNMRLRPDQVEYTMKTAEGVSGSPVWMADRGGESVVAIQ